VGTLVSEYLKAQELQLLAEGGMSDAIRMFVEKDDIHAIQTYVSLCLYLFLSCVSVEYDGDTDATSDSHVHKSLKNMLKNVGAGEEVDEDDLDELVRSPFFPRLNLMLTINDAHSSPKRKKRKSKNGKRGQGVKPRVKERYAALDLHPLSIHPSSNICPSHLLPLLRPNFSQLDTELTTSLQGKAKQAESEPADSEDSMMEDVETQGLAMDVDFSDDDPTPPPPKKRGAAAASKAAPAKRAPAKKAAAPAKKAPAKRGKKVVAPPSDEDEDDNDQEFQADEAEVIELDDDDEDDEPAPPPVKKRTNRAALLSQPVVTTKKAPAKKAAAGTTKKAPAKKVAAAATQQSQLNFAPAGRSTGRAAAGRSQARTRMVVDDDDDFEDDD
jgi:hypothetical protein